MNGLAHVPGPTFGKRAAAIGLSFAPDQEERSTDLLEDLKLFATGWLGGLVFFGTFLA